MNNETADTPLAAAESEVGGNENSPPALAAMTAEEAAALRAANEDLRKQLHIRTAIYELEKRLESLGARSPALLSQASQSQFQFDEKGRAVNLEALADKFRRDHPEQFRIEGEAPPASIDAAAGRNTAPPVTKEALARMTPGEIRQLDWAAVRGALEG